MLQPNSGDAQPAAVLIHERVRYTAGFNRPPREPRQLAQAPAVDLSNHPLEPVVENAQTQPVTDRSEPSVDLIESGRRRSSRSLQLPVRLSTDYTFDATTIRANGQTASAAATESTSRPIRRGRPPKCRVCKVNKKDARFICCGYELCLECADNIQALDGCCPECKRRGEDIEFQRILN